MSTQSTNSDPIDPEFVSDVVWDPVTFFVQQVGIDPPSKTKSRRNPQVPPVTPVPQQQIQVSQVKDIRHKPKSEQSTPNVLGGDQIGCRRRNRGKNFKNFNYNYNKDKDRQQGNRGESTRTCAFRISNSKPALPVLGEQDKEPRKQKLKGKLGRKVNAKALIGAEAVKTKFPIPKRPKALDLPETTGTEKELQPTDTTAQYPIINKTDMSGKKQNAQQSAAAANARSAPGKENPSKNQPPPRREVIVGNSNPTEPAPDDTHSYYPTDRIPHTEVEIVQRFYIGQCDRDGNGSFFGSKEQLKKEGYINLIVSHIGPFSYKSWSAEKKDFIGYTEALDKFDEKMNNHYKGRCGSVREAAKVDVCFPKGYYSVKEVEEDDDGNNFDQWYRVQVMEDEGVENSQVKAFFIDHGKVKMVEKKNIRFLCTAMASPSDEPLEAGFRYRALAYHARIDIKAYSEWFVEELVDHLSKAANAKIWYTFEVKNVETKDAPLLTLNPPEELTNPTAYTLRCRRTTL